MDFVRRDAEQEKKKEKIHKIYKISLACEQEKIYPQDLACEQEKIHPQDLQDLARRKKSNY